MKGWPAMELSLDACLLGGVLGATAVISTGKASTFRLEATHASHRRAASRSA